MAKTATADTRHAPLTQAGQALESSRDSGFDLSAAVGEVVDNSAEAGASKIRIRTMRIDDGATIDQIGMADDGAGVDPDILANVLSLGYSSRYNSRTGMGRFGMGLKLASLSQGRRIDVYTKRLDSTVIFHTYLDLDEVESGDQQELGVTELDAFPADYADLMAHPKTGEPFTSGTLVVWSKVDRLAEGGRYGASLDERIKDLVKFLARAYRKYIDQGLFLELDGTTVTLHDPLFLLENPRVIEKFAKDLRAEKLHAAPESTIEIEGHEVTVTVTLLPREFRDLYIPDNEGKISILRQNREIYYDLVPKLYPGGKERLDRYIGVEVNFPAALDEYFQVRNVKRGAEPVSKLRERLRNDLKKPIEAARKMIRDYWDEVQREENLASGGGAGHETAQDAVDEADETAPAGRANLDVTPEDVDSELDRIVEDLGLDPDDPATKEKADSIRTSYQKRAITIVDGGWPGKELMDIVHLSGKAIVKINHRHPFISEVYDPVKAMAALDPADLNVEDVTELLRKVDVGLDVLLMGYAKAENMHDKPEDAYGELRSYWGIFSGGYVRQAFD
jgi:anti-sigma regulatory factor (Ser/Thr protein kinase)